ncbi:hypothetical protein HGM15179_011645 [Zosterops borbonicus]|uniref:Octapeptide-repeat protein T2 n=1 Tax=Zosterops borbonicus TaxID=364589 RepID=A0A8K1GC13_9PASS|nr:hypothetical protein HGM15179_011645 [Zosterops borbonicus]
MEHWSSKWDPVEQGGIYSIECLPSLVEQEPCAGLGGGKPWKSWNRMEWNRKRRGEERRGEERRGEERRGEERRGEERRGEERRGEERRGEERRGEEMESNRIGIEERIE